MAGDESDSGSFVPHLFGSLLFLAGAFLQQHAYFKKQMSAKLAADCQNNKASLMMLSQTGLFLELAALALIPFATYILYGGLHLVFMVTTGVYNECRGQTQNERKGAALLAVGCLVALFLCGFEGEPDKAEFDSMFSGVPYLLILLATVFINVGMRAMGFYSGQVFLETSLLAQLHLWTLVFLKTAMLRVTAYLLDFDDTFTVPAILFLLSAVAFVLFGPFFKVVQERHDVVTVYASYLIWLVAIGVPFGVMEIGTGTPYTDATYFMLIVASAFTIVGAMTIGFYADEDGISLELQTLKPAI